MIGTLISQKEYRELIFDLTSEEDYPNLKPIFHIAHNQYSDGIEFDFITIESNAPKGWDTILQDLMVSGVSGGETGIKSYATILREETTFRNLKSGLQSLLADIDNESKSVSEITSDIKELTKADKGSVKALRPSEILEREYNNPKKEKLLTGVYKFDEVLYEDVGFYRGDVHTILAESGHGKTRYATLVSSLLLNSYKGMFFQLEDYDVNTATQFAALNVEHCDNILIDDSTQDIDEMARYARIVKNNEGLDFVVFDYIQEIKCANKGSKTLNTEYVCSAIKSIAKQLNCVCIVLSQVSIPDLRSGWKRFPRADDAKWAQAIKEVSHCITGVFRPNNVESLIESSKHIKDWKGDLKPYSSVYARVRKQRRGALKPDILHLIDVENKGLQVYSPMAEFESRMNYQK
jgi:replicative DNA helicase